MVDSVTIAKQWLEDQMKLLFRKDVDSVRIMISHTTMTKALILHQTQLFDQQLF